MIHFIIGLICFVLGMLVGVVIMCLMFAVKQADEAIQELKDEESIMTDAGN